MHIQSVIALTSSSVVDLLTSAAYVLVASAVLIVAIRGFKRLEAKVGGVHLVAEQVNSSVNNVPAGQPPLRDVVVSISERLDAHICESSSRFDRIEEHITKPPTGNIPVVQATRQRKKKEV